MKHPLNTLYDMDGTKIGTFRTLDWEGIQSLVREHHTDLASWDDLDIFEIPSGPMENAEVVINPKTGEWLACFDLDVVEHFRQAR